MRLMAEDHEQTDGEERRVLVADAWYGMAHPWYQMQHGEPPPRPTRVIFEYDTPTAQDQLPADGFPTLDREVSYQVKFFSVHGYWPEGQLSGLPPFSSSEMRMVRTVATMIVTHPQAPISVTTRDRLEVKGLLY